MARPVTLKKERRRNGTYFSSLAETVPAWIRIFFIYKRVRRNFFTIYHSSLFRKRKL